MWSEFLASWREVNSIGDDLGNLALFFPFGYIAHLLCARSPHRGRARLALTVLMVALSLGCQTAQLFTPARDPSIFDLYMNWGGATLGWVAGHVLPLGSRSRFLAGDRSAHMPLLIATAWVVSQLLPLVPSIDLQSWKDAVKPVLLYPRFHLPSFLLALCAWTTVFHLLERRVGLFLRAHYLSAAAVLVLAARIVIVVNHLSLTSTLALLCAVLVWAPVGRRISGQVLAVLLLFAFVLDALSPLALRAQAQDFGWLPFGGYLQGSMLVNARALTSKLFIFGSLALLLVARHRAAGPLAAAIAATLVIIECLQRWVGAGTPALTDPLLFLTVVWFVRRGATPAVRRNAH